MADEKYTVHAFVRTYDGDKLNYWSPCTERAVGAKSASEAEAIATREIGEELKNANIKVGGFLVDRVVAPDGRSVQCTAWDESGFPL